MIRWRSYAAVFALAGLTGCADGGFGEGFSFLAGGTSGPSTEPNSVLHQATLMNGRVRLKGPDGFCIDATSFDSSFESGFAVIASCNILSGGLIGPIVEPALVTVSVQESDAPELTASDLIAAIGAPGKTRRETAPAIVQFATGGETAFDGSDPRKWRGAFTRSGVSVSMALYAPEGSPLAGAAGGAFLETLHSEIRITPQEAAPIQAANAEKPADPVLAQLRRFFTRRDLQ